MLLAKSFDPACAICERLYDHRRELERRGFRQPPAAVRGPREARLLIVDLTPRTPLDAGAEESQLGSAKEVLIDALVAAGFASRTAGRSRLHATRITHAVRCATPGGGPTITEVRSCREYLMHDLAMLHTPGMRRTRCVVALGKLAYASVARALAVRLPPFEHGVESEPLQHLRVLGCLQPTPRNLDRGALTPGMLDGIFERCRELLAMEQSPTSGATEGWTGATRSPPPTLSPPLPSA